MRRRRLAAFLLVLMLAFPLAGCWDRSELEEEAFVLAIGVDKGKQSLYTVSFAIAHPSRLAGGGKGGGGGGGGGDEKPLVLTSVEAPTVAGAISMANSYLSRRVSLRHTKALFMGEELARQSGMFTMDEFVRFRQARRTIFYIVTKGKAADFLEKMKPTLEKDPQRYIEQMTYSVRHTGMVPAASQIQQYVTLVNTGYAQPITYYAALHEEGEEQSGKGTTQTEGYKAGELPRKGGANVDLLGGAAFRNEKMVGVLTGEDMRMILMLQDKFRRGIVSIPDPSKPDLFVSLEIHQGRPLRIDANLSGPKPRIHATVTLEGELLTVQSNADYTEPELQTKLEQATVGALEQRMRSLISKTQQWDTDVIGFGQEVVKQFPTVEAWERYRWQDWYKTAEISADVRFTLRRFGKQLSPPRPREQ
ncbi:MAG TPA: Ger(x)C family spore germination protein [Symbiobacteriaceae bacterium]|nr:Ger(x)C family spore germination protein [Symbiobacteriaceae bacterium]